MKKVAIFFFLLSFITHTSKIFALCVLSVSAGPKDQTKCSGAAINTIIIIASGDATGIGITHTSVTGMLFDVSQDTIITITGTPSVSFSYTVTAIGGSCNNSNNIQGEITVTPTVTISPFSPATSTRCQGAANISYTTNANNSTGITYSLDAITAAFSGNSIISTTGVVTYSAGWNGTTIITASAAGCNGPVTKNHVVTITPTVTISPFSPATSTRCQGAATISYTTNANNSTGITYSLDATTGAFSGNSINSTTGAVTYATGWSGTTTIFASAAGCNGPVTKTHVVTISPPVTISPFSPATSTRCQGAATISYTTNANNSTGITYSLDATTAAFSGNSIIPTTGAVTYSAGWNGTTIITASAAGCNGPVTKNHVVTITPTVTISPFSPATSTRCQGAATISYTTNANNSTGITYSLDATTGAFSGNSINSTTGAVTYATGWSGTTTIFASAAGCNGPVIKTHVVSVTPTNTVGSASSSPAPCANTSLAAIRHSTTGATGIGVASGLPSFVTASWDNNIITISGTPTVSGTFIYSIPLTGGCGVVNATGTITVKPRPLTPNITISGAGFCAPKTLQVQNPQAQVSYVWAKDGSDNPLETSPNFQILNNTLQINIPSKISVKALLNGCFSNAYSNEIEIKKTPDNPQLNPTSSGIPAKGLVDTYCGSTSLVATPASTDQSLSIPHTYQWFKDGIQQGETSSTLPNAPAPANYSVKILVNGCTSLFSDKTITVGNLPDISEVKFLPQAIPLIKNETALCKGAFGASFGFKVASTDNPQNKFKYVWKLVNTQDQEIFFREGSSGDSIMYAYDERFGLVTMDMPVDKAQVKLIVDKVERITGCKNSFPLNISLKDGPLSQEKPDIYLYKLKNSYSLVIRRNDVKSYLWGYDDEKEFYTPKKLPPLNTFQSYLFENLDSFNLHKYYWCEITDKAGCLSRVYYERPPIRFGRKAVELYDINDISVEIFPNPVIEKTRIEVKGGRENQYSIRIIDIRGKILESQELSGDPDGSNLFFADVSLDKLQGGTYWMEVSGKSGFKRIHKLVKY